MYRKVCIWIYLLSLFLTQSAQASDIELKNLRWDWEVYDKEIKQYVPYFKLPETEAIRFKVDLNKYRSSYLKLDLPGQYFIWIQDQLVFASAHSEIKYFALDSLYTLYGMGNIHVTIYNDNFDGHALGSTIVNLQEDSFLSTRQDLIAQRESGDLLDLFIIISIATMSLIAIFRAFNFRLFHEYLSLSKSLQLRQNFDLIIAHAPLAWPNIGFILFYSVLVGSAGMICDLFLSESNLVFPFTLNSSSTLIFGLKITLFCFVFMIAKLLLITAGSELFKLKKVRLIHFFTYFRLSLILASVAFSLSLINGVFDGMIVNNWWIGIQLSIVLFWSGRLILIYFVLNKIYTFRKLHLFSYLCSSELIPLLLFFKIFLK